MSATTWALVLAVVAAAESAWSQTALGPRTDDARDQLVEKIQLAEKILETQSKEGPHSKELIELFTALGLWYRETGNDGLAVATIEQALQVVRANYGLRSLEQLPLIRQRILSEEARGNFSAAWDYEQKLVALAKARPEDLRAATVFRDIGDKRMNLLERYLADEYPPQIILGCYYGGPQRLSNQLQNPSNCSAGSKRVAARTILEEAQQHYIDAIGVLLRHELQSSNELRELELKLIRSSYFYGGYETGRQSLVRLVAYDIANSEELMRRVDALVQVADWDLLFKQSPRALDVYQQIYAFLERQGLGRAALDEVFAPEVPVVLPTFLPSPLASDGSESTGYVDVAFDISRFGSSQRIEVLETSNVSATERQRLIKLISRSRFRPRLTDGEFARTSRVVVRYFVNE